MAPLTLSSRGTGVTDAPAVARLSAVLPNNVLPTPRVQGAAVSPATVVVRCLGPFEIRVDGAAIDSWRPSKARTLFQYLVTHRDRPIHRDVLIGALWPEADGLSVGSSLKVTVHTLRGALSQMQRHTGEALTISSEESGYQLRTSSLWLDVEQFEAAFRLGRAFEAQGQRDAALAAYAQAADCYRGEFLPEAWNDWVLFRRESLKDEYLFVLVRLADAAFQAEDFASCLHYCQMLLGEDHCREDTYRMLMVCHARLGQLGRVRRWYELCVRALAAELDAAPAPETELVLHQALAGKFVPHAALVPA